jgi:hypothetical protein
MSIHLHAHAVKQCHSALRHIHPHLDPHVHAVKQMSLYCGVSCHGCTYTHTHTTHTHTHTHVSTPTHTSSFRPIKVCPSTCMSTQSKHVTLLWGHVWVRWATYTYTQPQTHSHTYTHTHTYTHKHTHTFTQLHTKHTHVHTHTYTQP